MPKLKLPNIDDVVAIDIHTHAEEPCGMHGDDGYDDFQAQMADYFKSPHKHPPTVPETAAYYRSKNIAAVIFPVDAERETGFRRYNNYEMLEVASDNLDVLIPFVSIDPHKGKLGVREARKLIEEYGVRGFKFHPTMQGFYPNDRMAYPLYEAINDGGAIALFHTGQTGVGSGMPGGMGMRLKYSNPMYMDDVAADFPDLKIILAHPVLPLAGRGAVGRDPQAERLYRPLRLVAEIFPADPGALHQLDPAGQDAVRLGLAGDHAGPLAVGFRQARDPRRDPAEGAEGQRAEDFGYMKRRPTHRRDAVAREVVLDEPRRKRAFVAALSDRKRRPRCLRPCRAVRATVVDFENPLPARNRCRATCDNRQGAALRPPWCCCMAATATGSGSTNAGASGSPPGAM